MLLLFDPVIFENLKVALENQLYDLDNLDNRIAIIDRKDTLDMAVMSRTWSLGFTFPQLVSDPSFKAEIVLFSSIQDLADEILQRKGAAPACSLLLRFTCQIEQPAVACPQIEQIIASIWQRELQPKQLLIASYGAETRTTQDSGLWIPLYYENVIELPFNRRINEEQMEDLEELIEHVMMTLDALHELCYSSK